MDIKTKWQYWRWLHKHGLSGKRQLRAIPKDRDIESLIKKLSPEERRAMLAGQNPPKKVREPHTGPSTYREAMKGLKSDPGWTQSARDDFFASQEWRSVPIPEKHDVFLRIVALSTSNMNITAGFSGLLIDNTYL